MDAEALIDGIPSLSHNRMLFVLSAFTKRQTERPHSFHLRRMIGENGIAQLYCRSLRYCSFFGKLWMLRSVEALISQQITERLWLSSCRSLPSIILESE
jgi:hypothetical protein